MNEWLIRITEPAIVVIDGIALVMVIIGTIEALIRVVPVMFASPSGQQRRDIWLRYARWLVAALTFQLAADIIESSISTSWEAVGRLGAIAVIRTFLDYFLERDVSEKRDLQRARESRAAKD
ncbi:MAG TPA: DUF1622 domain-containing protein [Steroidobacteraceae bacterium]|nr:DUF1622 domain-containing protein [Steroidobacteraceae bacterium]